MWEFWRKNIGFLNTNFWSKDRCKYFVTGITNFIFDIP